MVSQKNKIHFFYRLAGRACWRPFSILPRRVFGIILITRMDGLVSGAFCRGLGCLAAAGYSIPPASALTSFIGGWRLAHG